MYVTAASSTARINLYSVWSMHTSICLYKRVCGPKRTGPDGVCEVNACRLSL